MLSYINVLQKGLTEGYVPQLLAERSTLETLLPDSDHYNLL